MRRGTLVAFVRLFSTVRFQMGPQNVCSFLFLNSYNGIAFIQIITLKMFIHYHCDKGDVRRNTYWKLRKI